jgi:hypothetical protein
MVRALAWPPSKPSSMSVVSVTLTSQSGAVAWPWW